MCVHVCVGVWVCVGVCVCLFLCGEEVFTVATSWLCGDARSVARVWLQFFCLSDLLAPSLPLHARWKKEIHDYSSTKLLKSGQNASMVCGSMNRWRRVATSC